LTSAHMTHVPMDACTATPMQIRCGRREIGRGSIQAALAFVPGDLRSDSRPEAEFFGLLMENMVESADNSCQIAKNIYHNS